MSVLLRAELLKLRTTRTFAALVAASLALSLLAVGLTAAIADEWGPRQVRELFTADFTGLFITLLGVMGMAGEWRHRTITGTVLATPDRTKLLAAKVLSYAVAGMVLSLIVTASIMALGSAILGARDLPTLGIGDLADVLWRNLVVAALFGALGVGVGALVRNQVVAVVGVLIVGFVLEPVLLGVVPDVARYLPIIGLPSGIQDVDSGFPEAGLLAPLPALALMLAWVAALFAAGAATLRRRDVV